MAKLAGLRKIGGCRAGLAAWICGGGGNDEMSGRVVKELFLYFQFKSFPGKVVVLITESVGGSYLHAKW